MSLQRNNIIQRIKTAPPPSELPLFGKDKGDIVSYIGKTNYTAALEEKKFIFGIKRTDRKKHIYIIGKSGVGKSKLIELLVRQDIGYGKGCCVIDPNGDLVNDLLDFIPVSRVKDVVVIDPRDTQYPVCLNPFNIAGASQKYQAVTGLIDVMRSFFGNEWKPRLEHVFRYTAMALMEYPEANLTSVLEMLSHTDFRNKVLTYSNDPLVLRFFEFEFPRLQKKYEGTVIIPLMNKIGQLVTSPHIRPLFDQRQVSIDFNELIAEKKIILVHIAKGTIGEENARFLGALILSQLKLAGMRRGELPELERPDFYIYVDEFHTIITETFEQFLAESRRYGFAFTIAHQYVWQLQWTTQQAVLGTVGTLIVFRIGSDDAEKLVGELEPTFTKKDMTGLGESQFYIKMTIDGENSDPFSAETLRVLPSPEGSHAKDILQYSRMCYTCEIE